MKEVLLFVSRFSVNHNINKLYFVGVALLIVTASCMIYLERCIHNFNEHLYILSLVYSMCIKQSVPTTLHLLCMCTQLIHILDIYSFKKWHFVVPYFLDFAKKRLCQRRMASLIISAMSTS